MGSGQTKYTREVRYPSASSVAQLPSSSNQQNSQIIARSHPESALNNLVQIQNKESALSEVALNSLMSCNTKKRLKGTKNISKQSDLEDGIDEVIQIDGKRIQNVNLLPGIQQAPKSQRKLEFHREKRSRVSKLL